MIKSINPPPKISVIMATFNDGEDLHKSINSILNQSFSDYELIIIDDASTDLITSKIILEYSKRDARIIHISNHQNMGRAGARNLGIMKAKGELIAIMDGDDFSLPNRFDTQLSFLYNNSEIGYLGGGAELISKETGKIVDSFNPPLNHAEIVWNLCFTYPFVHSTTIGYKKLFLDAGLFNTKIARCEDRDLWNKISRISKLGNIPENVCKYYIYTKKQPADLQLTFETAREIHLNYISDWLGYRVSDNSGDILLNLASVGHKKIEPNSISEVINSANTLFSLYGKINDKIVISANERLNIETDVLQKIFKLLLINISVFKSFFPKYALAFMAQAYWKKRLPKAIWGIPFFFSHPKTALIILYREIRDRSKRYYGK